MIIPSIIPGVDAPTENSFNVESTAGEGVESIDFSNLLASLVGAVPQAIVSAESAGDAMVDSAPSVADDNQVAQEPDENSLEPSAIVAFMAPFSPTLATIVAPEPTTARTSETAAIVAAPITVDVNIDADDAVDGDAENYQPVHAAPFSLPLEPPLATAALVQNLDKKTDRMPFANEAGQPQDDDGAGFYAKAPLSDVAAAVGIAVAIDTAMLEQSESTRSGELLSGTVEPRVDQEKAKPADVLDSVVAIDDVTVAVPREFKSLDSERRVKPAERQSIDSEYFARESTAIDEKDRQVRPIAVSQSSFAHQQEESFADDSQFKPLTLTVDPQDGPPQRLVPMAADAAAAKLSQENVAIENPGTPAWRPVVQRITEQIVRQVRIGEQQAIIELEPPELGKIKIDLRIEGGQIHARIVAEEQGTKALIESRLGELRQALEVRQVDLANLQVEQQNVSSGGAEWGQTLNDESRQGRGPWQDDSGFADRSANDPPQGESSQSPASDPGRISMWA
jgi:flagellar hook-length control protein FliK